VVRKTRGRGRGGKKGPNLWQYIGVSLGMGAVYMLVIKNVILDTLNPLSWAIFVVWTFFSGTVWYYMTRG